MPSAASTSAMALKWLTLKPGYSKPTATFERLRSFVWCRLPAQKTGPRLVLRLPPVSPEESHPGQVNGSHEARRRRSDRGCAGTVSRETCRADFTERWLPLKGVDALAACTDATLALSRLLPGALQVCHWVSGSPFCAAQLRRGRRRPACVRTRTIHVADP
jgi:hypothetical protein